MSFIREKKKTGNAAPIYVQVLLRAFSGLQMLGAWLEHLLPSFCLLMWSEEPNKVSCMTMKEGPLELFISEMHGMMTFLLSQERFLARFYTSVCESVCKAVFSG